MRHVYVMKCNKEYWKRSLRSWKGYASRFVNSFATRINKCIFHWMRIRIGGLNHSLNAMYSTYERIHH